MAHPQAQLQLTDFAWNVIRLPAPGTAPALGDAADAQPMAADVSKEDGASLPERVSCSRRRAVADAAVTLLLKVSTDVFEDESEAEDEAEDEGGEKKRCDGVDPGSATGDAVCDDLMAVSGGVTNGAHTSTKHEDASPMTIHAAVGELGRFISAVYRDYDESDPMVDVVFHAGTSDERHLPVPASVLLNSGSSFLETAVRGSDHDPPADAACDAPAAAAAAAAVNCGPVWKEARDRRLVLDPSEGFQGAPVLALAAILFDPAVLQDCLLGDTVVSMFRIGYFLCLQGLQDAAEATICNAVELDNALQLLDLASSLLPQPRLLLSATRTFVLRHFDEIKTSEAWQTVRPEVRAEMETIKLVASTSPVRWTGDVESVFSAREMLAVLREALREQKERFAEAMRRSHQPGQTMSSYVGGVLEERRRSIARLEQFVEQQRGALETQERMAANGLWT